MDQDTRNKLQRATQQVRRILEEEFAEQLEGTFDVLPDGKILPEPGKHLDARQRLTRQKLVDAIEHIKAGGKTPQEAVDEYTREAAFTFLNRFVALRMLEARELLQECVSKGDASSGFKEFCGLAPGLSSLDDGGYRLYLECLFDELTVEVKVLFDRRDSASMLWPRRGTLTELLEILGQADLTGAWSEDETIGWVYQYFNSGEERKKMRDESQAPRNSRELAVRNQFFTPRYVVEFLTDNTLGRIWYEMRKGETRLVDECDYLVRRQSEIFLEEGQDPPANNSDAELELSQEDLLRKAAYIPHRAKKDPRDLKIIDPACGSGHFLLYAFDLLVTVYDETWHDEASPKSEVTGRRLRDDFVDLHQLHAALPGQVIAHNLHGIDIDPRAAQIAALALWMRGQRALNEYQISRESRPTITKSNIVCAEPMPGEAEFLDEFIAESLVDDAEGRFLANLVRRVFEVMKLAGEAGSLLKVEEDIAEEVAKAKKQWLNRPEFKQQTLFEDGPGTVQQELDLTRGITDESFWDEAEKQIYDALSRYAERAEGSGYQRRLFSADTARGFAFIDLCRTRYDVALMNPPFGEAAKGAAAYQREHYPSSKQDIFQCFVERFVGQLEPDAFLGALSARTGFFMGDSESWRTEIVWKNNLALFADLGLGVLDDALVEAAAYSIRKTQGTDASIVASRHLATRNKEAGLREAVVNANSHGGIHRDLFIVPQSVIEMIPGGVFGYWAPIRILNRFQLPTSFEKNVGQVRVGLQTGDDFRFARLAWEVPTQAIGSDTNARWHRFSKGGEYSPPYDDIHLVVDWSHDGDVLRTTTSSRVQNDSWYRLPGATYTVRTASAFAAKILPSGCVFSHNAQSWFVDNEKELLKSVCYFMTRVPQAYIELAVGGGDIATSGSAARRYTTKVVHSIPASVLKALTYPEFESDCCDLLRLVAFDQSIDESSCLFSGFDLSSANNLAQAAREVMAQRQELISKALSASWRLDEAVTAAWGLDHAEKEFVANEIGKHPCEYEHTDAQAIEELWQQSIENIIGTGVEKQGASRWLTKKSYFVDRKTELICHIVPCNPESVEHAVSKMEVDAEPIAKEFLSHCVGHSFGRWASQAYGSKGFEEFVKNPFGELPNRPPASGTVDQRRILADDEGHEADICDSIETSVSQLWPIRKSSYWEEFSRCIGTPMRQWVRQNFFSFHLSSYSKSRRKAPIYWQLATPSAAYSVWLYYHRLTKDTFFQVLNEFVKPKLNHERQKLDRMQGEAGVEPSRSQRKEIEDQEKIVAELASMVEEVERIAPLWNANLNDGVIINFAPLWRLVPQNKSWQKECKKCWDKLVKGEYDWAHLAMHLWPERVVPKCVTDASLAIAHGLEEVFWEKDDRDRFRPKEEPAGGWEPIVKELVSERTSPAVKAALESLLTAPAPAGNSKSRRRKATT